MKISISLSEASIERAINRLEKMRDNLQQGLEETVEILANEGGNVAQAAYGDMAKAGGFANGTEGSIISTGENNLIAEFGAGDGVIPVKFKNEPTTPVYAGSYSEQNAQQYSRWGFWYFGGEVYTEIPARHGLLDAKRYVIEHSTETAREVIEL